MSRRSPLFCHIFLLVSLLTLLLPYRVEAQDEFVHVRLLKDAGPRTIVVSSTKPLRLYTVGVENPISQIPANEKLTLTTSSERIYLTSSEGGIYANNLVLAQTDNAELTIEVADGENRVAPRTYRGAFQIEVEQNPTYKLKIVNAVPLEDYVVSVLSSEFGFNELEGSKALAVCIRTLALKSLTSQNEPNFAVADDESWQVYRGTEAITPTAIRATQETLGQVLVYDEKLIDAVYFASSGGVTANNEDVWNASRSEPYLRGKDDAYDSSSPHNTWTSRVPRSQLLTYLSDLYNVPVTGFTIGSVNRRDSRVKSIRLNTQGNSNVTISGSEFREKVNARFGRESLKSTLFTVDERSNQYVFEGRGYGHGVGLNQWGARELSRRGQLYDEILKFYYTDVEVEFFEMLGRQSFTYANKVETNSVSSDVPRIDWNNPSAVVSDQTTYADFDRSDDRFSSNSSSSLDSDQEFDLNQPDSSTSSQSIRSRLFDSDEDYTVESGDESSNSSVRGSKKDKKRIYSDRPIVGWSKTVDPQATALSDSVKTRTKRRKGW